MPKERKLGLDIPGSVTDESVGDPRGGYEGLGLNQL
jgi:hypothetical protein